jgi:hypothetical protein
MMSREEDNGNKNGSDAFPSRGLPEMHCKVMLRFVDSLHSDQYWLFSYIKSMSLLRWAL